jgi:DNA (cytosine-5)-methyltransferase 1
MKPWRTAAECIDWSIPCPSIFDRKRPLVENTMARIARGLKRYVIDAARPFIVPVTHAGDERVHGIDEPLRTITTAQRGEQALVTPFVTKFRGGATGHPVDEPLHTVTANSFIDRPGGATPLGLVAPVVVSTAHSKSTGRGSGTWSAADPLRTVAGSTDHAVVAGFLKPRYGERKGQAPRAASLDRPMPVVVPTGNGGDLVAAFMAQHNTGVTGHAMEEPVSTLTQGGAQQQLVSAWIKRDFGTSTGAPVTGPLPTVTTDGGGHASLMHAFLQKYYGTGGQDQDIADPMHTLTAKARMGLVTVAGILHRIVDIGMRMLEPRELYRAQGFPDSYIIDRGPDGKPLTKTAQIRMCGNSVCPPIAAALVSANCGALAAAEAEVA